MPTYTRHAICTNGHSVEVSFDWDPYATRGELKEYSKPCPVSECAGRVEFALPIGSAPESIELVGP
jgi:hypothetical protein